MLPVQLELKNFLAYRHLEPLIFDGIHLACLSGANGAGKSSLLDAITWAIWGKSRARSDDDLIHIGQDETQVILDFVQNETRYRLVRKRRLGKARKNGTRGAGTTTLDFFAFDEATNVYRLINEPTIRETQKRIIELLSLDHETFVNSAFLQQGQADAFTIKTPAQRKEILAEILGLNRWLVYEERVKQRLRDIENELTTIDLRLEEIEKEQAEEPAIRQNLEAAQVDLEELQQAANAAQEAYNEYAGADKALQSAKSELENLHRMVREQDKSHQDAEAEVSRNQERLGKYQAVIEERESIEAGYQQLQEARQANEALADALRDLHNVEKRINTLTNKINAERQERELELSQIQTRIDDAQEISQHLETLHEQETELQSDLDQLKTIETERDECHAETGSLKEELARLETENEALKTEMYDIRQRMNLIESAPEAKCPVCGQPLDDKHRRKILDDYQQQGSQRGDRYRQNDSRIIAINEEVVALQGKIAQHNEVLAQLPQIGSQLGSIEQQLKDAEEAANRVETLVSQRDTLAKVLSDEDYAHELRQQLVETQEEQAKLAYDPNAHEAIKETLETYRAFQDQANALEVALQAIPDVEAAIEAAQKRADRWAGMLAETQQKVIDREDSLAELELKAAELERRREELSHQNTLVRQASERVIGLEQRLSAIEAQRKRAETLATRAESLREEQGIYEQLRRAFSKNGIPAMLIDAAIPELEETANYLLRKMTAGRMTVRFDTQREKKTGGIAETFDIWISDELGTRDYSMYSGGEAFRVNFAIRVAISQLLARRAGAQLRTLFIDEGFGTQDEAGRQRLIEAINAVQEDFDLILVITHIDELRDVFPVRIEVEKLAEGSRIQLM